MIFKKTHVASRGTATYTSAEGLTLYAPKSVGEQPDALEVGGLSAPAPKAAKPKPSPEERKAAAAERRAANAKLTPAQKLQAEEARLAKRAASLAARKTKLAGGDSASA
jgi:hypothetical protein